jgi:multiple sugar transport system substrate-binding protein
VIANIDRARRRSLQALLAVGVALALPIDAAATAAADDLSGTLSFMVAEYSPKTAPFWQDQVKAFQAAHPGVKVNLEVVGWQQMHDTTVQRIAAGSLPDLVNTATIWLPEWVEANAIQEVGPDYVSAKVMGDVVPALLEKGAAYKGKSYGLPIAAGGRGLFINNKLFRDAGLDPAKPPATFDDFKKAIVQIKEKTGQFGFAFDAKGVQAFRYFGFFLWNSGGDFFTADGKAAFNSDAGVKALSFLVDLAKTGAIPDPTGATIEDLEPMFLAGRLAMLIDGNYFATNIKNNAPNLDFSVVPTPTADAKLPSILWGVTDTLVIGKKATPALVKAFIDQIYQTASRTTFDVNEGILPLLKSQASAPEFANDKVQSAFIQMMPNARFDPLNPHYSQMQELVKTAMQQALTGTDAKAALDEAATAFNALAGQ